MAVFVFVLMVLGGGRCSRVAVAVVDVVVAASVVAAVAVVVAVAGAVVMWSSC